MYERGNVTIDYLEGTSFLLCRSYRHMFPLGLCQYLEDWYVFSLGPQHFSLAPFPRDAHPCSLTNLPFLSGVGLIFDRHYVHHSCDPRGQLYLL